ncbi:DNA-binding protein, partial [Clostridium botulinum]|nr:DNA-binding protein [Clostridium botulinum]
QGNDSLDIYFMPDGLDIKKGDVVNVEGTMGRYNKTIQIYGGSCIFTKVDEVAKLNINHEAIKQADINSDLNIDAEITGTEISNVELNYKVTGAEKFEKLEMIKGEGNKYSATIGKEKLNLNGLEYYISAKDKNGDNNTETYYVRVTNGIAPEIYDMFPAENSRVKVDDFSSIKASIKSKKEINTDSIKVYLDNNDVTSSAKITKEAIEYTPSEKPNIGSHTVKIEVKDSIG